MHAGAHTRRDGAPTCTHLCTRARRDGIVQCLRNLHPVLLEPSPVWRAGDAVRRYAAGERAAWPARVTLRINAALREELGESMPGRTPFPGLSHGHGVRPGHRKQVRDRSGARSQQPCTADVLIRLMCSAAVCGKPAESVSFIEAPGLFCKKLAGKIS